ncbi:hypothetical protein Cpin_5991 [Chitinophaga pinensis DSM 2588]|uniref:Uncharacterized protein n=1 Tax=Chitinophaga pinensis (strain ATCC 43595 / DSM 2588 / LMG 13176 / NBRC 15968 / NCIMB 11800 / UQM 2034) TaxID=485918 RepID=A0A979G9R3_CHIPD|nr:hypothetical protein Cpin_5991 [Chitinophaga pinensis DSM 2588]
MLKNNIKIEKNNKGLVQKNQPFIIPTKQSSLSKHYYASRAAPFTLPINKWKKYLFLYRVAPLLYRFAPHIHLRLTRYFSP